MEQKVKWALALLGVIIFIIISYETMDDRHKAHEFVVFGYWSSLEKLLKDGLDPMCEHRTMDLLESAILYGRPKCAKIILEYGADPNRLHFEITKMNYLQTALSSNEPEIAKLLIDFGADLNHVDKDGENALWYSTKQYSSFTYLISKGISLNHLNNKGESIIFKVINSCNVQLFSYLLEHAPYLLQIEDKNGKLPTEKIEENECSAIQSQINRLEREKKRN